MSPHVTSSPAQGLAKLLGQSRRAVRAVICVRRGDLGGKNIFFMLPQRKFGIFWLIFSCKSEQGRGRSCVRCSGVGLGVCICQQLALTGRKHPMDTPWEQGMAPQCPALHRAVTGRVLPAASQQMFFQQHLKALLDQVKRKPWKNPSAQTPCRPQPIWAL